MIEVDVKFYGLLRNVVKDKKKTIELKDCCVEDLVDTLTQHYGEELKAKIIDPKTNQLNERMVLFLNGINIKSLQGVKTELKDGDVIIMFPPSAGG